jgi:hypothetical protein
MKLCKPGIAGTDQRLDRVVFRASIKQYLRYIGLFDVLERSSKVFEN